MLTDQMESAMTALSRVLNDKRVALSILLSFTLLLSGCAKIQLLTYPSEFTYLDADTTKGVMHEMAISLSALDELVQQAARNSDSDRYQPLILAQLQNIEALATSVSSHATGKTLEGDDRPVTNHLLIDEHIDDFIGQIMKAKLQTEAEPPNYYGAGQLTGSCNACHRMR